MRADWKNAEWSKYLYDNIPESMLRAKLSDGDLYYKGYNELSDAHKREFFVMLFSSLARFESEFDPKCTFKEDKKDNNGNYVISRGLFQVSVESLAGYGFKTKAELLHDPFENIRAMLVIANRWITRDKLFSDSEHKKDAKGNLLYDRKGKPVIQWYGLAKYWAPFRKAHRIAAIRKNTNKLKFKKEIK